MFSTFVGLGRFINCQRPDHTVHHAFMSTDFLKILFRIFAPLSDIPEYVPCQAVVCYSRTVFLIDWESDSSSPQYPDLLPPQYHSQTHAAPHDK